MDEKTKQFILWLCDLKSPFHVHYNGEDKTKPRISYIKGEKYDKEYTLEEVFEFYETKVLNN
jgi:hypothetical protein